MKKRELEWWRLSVLFSTIVFLYFSSCSGLPTAVFSCNRPSQSNHFVSNNAARVRAAQQMHARNQVPDTLKEWLGKSNIFLFEG